MKPVMAKYSKAVKFGENLEKILPWVLLIFFIGLGCGYAWAYTHFVKGG